MTMVCTFNSRHISNPKYNTVLVDVTDCLLSMKINIYIFQLSFHDTNPNDTNPIKLILDKFSPLESIF